MNTSHSRYPSLNPSTPPFEPSGRELAICSDYPNSNPQALTSSNDISQLVLQSNSRMTREIRSLERQNDVMAEDIKSITETLGSDLQSLQRMIYGLRSRIDSIEAEQTTRPKTIDLNEQDHHIIALIRAFKANATTAPPDDLKRLAGSKENLAEAYIEQAEDAERFAAKLREHAHNILGDVIATPTSNAMKSMSITTNTRGEVASIVVDGDVEQGNEAQPNIEKTPWVPRAVREMPRYSSEIPNVSESFTWEFLTTQLGGEKWSPGYYFVSGDSIIKSKGYWILEADWEPFLPASPGQNGAKLTVFFNDTFYERDDVPAEENYMNIPVFIRPKGQDRYHYFGQYSQSRFSDKLDYDRVTVNVPEHVRHAQAEQLADPRRPEWVTRALMENFWPKPTYMGPLPKAVGGGSDGNDDGNDDGKTKPDIANALWRHAEALVEWEHDARMRAKLLTTTALVEAFGNADAAAEPGLRMYWEYLQCVAWDQGFFEMLVQRQRETAGGRQASAKIDDGVVGGEGRAGPRENGAETGVLGNGSGHGEGGSKEKKSGLLGDGNAHGPRRYLEFSNLSKAGGNGMSRRH